MRRPRRPAAPVPKPNGRPSKYRRLFCDQVEAKMGEGYSLTAFAGMIGVSHTTVRRWIDSRPAFAEAVARGRARRLAFWEAAALEVAAKGGGTGSVTMIVFGLKNMGPEEWSDTSRREITGRGGETLRIEHRAADLSRLTAEELETLERILRKSTSTVSGSGPNQRQVAEPG